MLSGGRTLPAVDFGGGLELAPTSRAVVRLDVGDRLVRYPGPVLDGDRRTRQSPFLSHDVRVAFGAALRF